MSISNDLSAVLSLWDQTGDYQDFGHAIGTMFSQVESFAEDTDTVVGWQPLWDVNLATGTGLAWLAQVVGERVKPGSTDAQARALIQATPNQSRGTPQGVADAIKQCLTGAQTVGLRERFTDAGTADDDALAIATYLSQTPDQNAVLAAIRRTLPADIRPYYTCISGNTWAVLEGGSTWSAIELADGPTWANIQSASVLSGYTIY